MTAGGAAAALAAVLLLRRFGAVAWPWLVLGGAVLGLTAAVPYAVPPDQLDMIRSPAFVMAFVMAFGAAPVLVVVGLYGAASWLNHVASLPAAAPAMGAVVLAPLAGMLLLPVIGGELPAASPLHGIMAVLAVVSVLAAAGCAALVLSVRPALPVLSLSGRALLVGVLAGLLPAAPELVMGIGWHPVQIAVAADPEEPMREVWDAVLTITAFLAGDVAAPEPLSPPISAATLVLAGLAVVTAVPAAASALPEPTTLPVAFGLLAVAVQLGLYNMGAFTQHSAVATQRRSLDANADQAP
jgi:hypothetical protein